MEATMKATQMLSDVPGGATPGRVEVLAWLLVEHPDLQLRVCADEHTGRRYGLAKCRPGRCCKLGNGGGRTGARTYQVWAVW